MIDHSITDYHLSTNVTALLLFCDLLVQNHKFRKFDLTIQHLKTNRCISAAPYRASCWNLT